MKKFFSPAVILALALALFACSQRPVLDPQCAATEFFQKIGEMRFQDAYDATAYGFQTQTTFPNFQTTAKELGLGGGTVSCHWESEEAKDRDIKLKGELVSANGTTVPVRLTLIEERGAWRVFALRVVREQGKQDDDRFSLLGKPATFNSSASREIPSAKVLNELTLNSLLLFNEAITHQSFGEFYSKVSDAWQKQLTTTQLKQAFQPFVDAKVDLAGIEKLQPVFDKPAEINSDGILTTVGHYDNKPYGTYFTLRYIFEFPYWKIYGIEVQIRG